MKLHGESVGKEHSMPRAGHQLSWNHSGNQSSIAYDAKGRIDIVVDWKSDVEIDADQLTAYHVQLDAYRRETGAEQALLVLMTLARVIAA
jgi:hypothetical protein